MPDVAAMIEAVKAAANPRERATLKAQLHFELARSLKRKERSFQLKDGRTVVIEDIQFGIFDGRRFYQQEGKTPAVWFRISVDGEYLNGDGWYGFVNPPVMVPDGTKRFVVDEITQEGLWVDNFKDDPGAALKAMIARAVGGEL